MTEGSSVLSTLARLAAHAHPAIVHFPIAALVLAAGARVAARERLADAVRLLLVVAVLGAIFAVGAGTLLASAETVSGYGTHQTLGWLTLALAVTALWVSRFAPGRSQLLTVLLVIAAVAVAATGHTGGALVFGPEFFTP
jgi:uncharacterized membrane protein